MSRNLKGVPYSCFQNEQETVFNPYIERWCQSSEDEFSETQTSLRSQATLRQVCKGKHQLYVSSSGSTITAELKTRFHEPRPKMSMQNRPMDLLSIAACLALIGVEVAKLLSTKQETRPVTMGTDNGRYTPTTLH
jgi:hypothetical protein